jgi:ADP-ribosylglycohydrolase
VIPTTGALRDLLKIAIVDAAEQGHVTDGIEERLASLPDSYDALLEFAGQLAELPVREDWPWVEPDDLAEIRSECDWPAHTTAVDDARPRIEAAFLARVCGCMLGKPLELGVTMDEIRAVLDRTGEWPLGDYVSLQAIDALPRKHGQWTETARERITHMAPDDDINYTVIGMLVLEQHGATFTHDDLRRAWMYQLPVLATFGPERTMLVHAAVASLTDEKPKPLPLNPRGEWCGAMIRADAYAYACPGDSGRAAELAWRDASWTHRRTGIYGAMFAAAAIATAFTAPPDRMAIVETALGVVPRRSRFHRAVCDALEDVTKSHDWLDGYRRVHERFNQYGFCRIFQETATLINTIRFARDAGDGICLQVMQGNDTDSYGATAGSILGAYFGAIEPRWYEPFNDDIHLAMATFYERSLSRLARRMAELPSKI